MAESKELAALTTNNTKAGTASSAAVDLSSCISLDDFQQQGTITSGVVLLLTGQPELNPCKAEDNVGPNELYAQQTLFTESSCRLSLASESAGGVDGATVNRKKRQ